MSTSITRSLALLASALATAATLMAAAPAAADDTELFVGEAVVTDPARPNILFILDTSGSMDGDVQTQAPYDPGYDFDGPYDDDRLYWQTGSDPLPPCEDDDDDEDWDGDGIDDCDNDDSAQWVDEDAFRCAAGQRLLDSAGLAAMAPAAQWRRVSGSWRWTTMSTGSNDDDDYVECGADAGVHGSTATSTKRWAANGSSGPWSSSSSSKIDWSGRQAVTFYTANYLNWSRSPFTTRTRFEIMQEAATNLLDSMDDNVNVGLMRYSNDGLTGDRRAEGGMVIEPIRPIEDNRELMKDAINDWDPDGYTPLSETLYEAHQYFTGGNVKWGSTSDMFAGTDDSDTPSAAAACNSGNCTAAGATYLSPMTEACQKNFIVFLTDGLPTRDSQSDADIGTLIGGTCDADTDLEDGTGICTDDLAKYMQESDLKGTTDDGTQNVTSYWIGFGPDVATGSRFLEHVALGGGAQFYTAADTAELTQAFTDIVSRILSQTSTFTAPTVAVNAFNRTQNLNFLYMSVFKPSEHYRWLGNIKKYRVTPTGAIRDVNDNLAVDPNTGFFFDGSQSFWSDAVDGPDSELGGAAGELNDPANRKLYTMTGAESGVLSEELSALKLPANLDAAKLWLFGLSPTDPLVDRPTTTVGLSGLVDWAYGHDTMDDDGDNDLTEARMDMGDPLHSRPATVIYGGPASDPDITLYATTNDGFLQAVNASTGRELWSFVPKEMLGRLEELMLNQEASSRVYGLDGAVEVVRLDRNGNGTIEPAGTDIDGSGSVEDDEKDHVYLYFGMRRGGFHYYGFDVTDRTAPQLMWRIGQADASLGSGKELPGVGQTWAAPQVTRVNVNRSWGSNTDKMVLVIGGGYDTAQDTIAWVGDGVGNRVYMVDALTGNLIWRAGPTSDAGAQLQLAKMTNSIPGEIRAIDLTGDGFADRMYAADLGGRVWRFDLRNGQTAANLAYGGVFASLGMGDDADHLPVADNRRFFFAPDISFLKVGTQSWLNVAIGSGHREKPITDDVVVNRFYSLRDHNMFAQVTNGQYKTLCGATETSPCHQIITDGEPPLVDVSTDLTKTVPIGGAGWRMNLTDGTEKVLAESRTFQNQIYFTTYSPEEREFDESICVATVGLNRLYVVDAATGGPVFHFDTETNEPLSVEDRFKELAQGSIAPEAIFVFPTPDVDPNDPNAPVPAVPPICLVGLESCGTGLANPPVRTYWQQRGTN